MEEFLAYRILEGKLEYKKVPARLKERVKEILVELGHAELVVE